jgi:tetratricopeptide (TPR) repeat protein
LIDWKNLTAEAFESLCYDVLANSGFKNLEWMGRTGGDRGRDILGYKPQSITEIKEIQRRFLVQCKKYRPSVTDLNNVIAWADAHDPNVLMLMVSDTLTSDTHDWIDKMKPKKRYDIIVFEEKDFEDFFDRHGETFVKHFGKERLAPGKQIISLLLDGDDQALQTIVTKTSLSEEQVKATLRNLEDQKIVSHRVTETTESYHLMRDLTTLQSLTKEFLSDEPTRFQVLSSEYFQSLIASDLANNIESRFHLLLDATQKATLLKLLKISPSALNAVFFLPTTKYETAYAHLQELGLKGEDRERWNQSILTEFMSTLLEKTLADLREPEAKAVLSKNNIEGFDVGIKIMMANPRELVLGLASEIIVLLFKAGEPIKMGQFVSARDPEVYVRTGDILQQLQLFEQAIIQYDRAISELKENNKLAAAWNNKGVCHMALRRWHKAISCFEKALELDPEIEQPRENIKKCSLALQD